MGLAGYVLRLLIRVSTRCLARQHHRTASSSQLATRDAVVLLGASILAQWSDAAKELAPMPVSNLASPGRTTKGLLYCSEAPRDSRVWVIYCGGNDLYVGRSPQETATKIEHFLEFAPRATQIVLVGQLRSPDRLAWAERVTELNTLLQALATRDPHQRALYVEPNTNLEGRDHSALFCADGIHPNELGYRVFASNLRPTIAQAWVRAGGSPAGLDSPSQSKGIVVVSTAPPGVALASEAKDVDVQIEQDPAEDEEEERRAEANA